jgi:sterol desaturase/sphingolipid hydroxylase (fatty acid hydroxylase superfamily)
MLKLNCVNVLVLGPLLTINNIYNKSALPLFEIDELPGFGKFYIQYWWMLMIEDFCFYWAHRFFHTKWIYPWVHKVHHESKQTLAISSIGTHPVEYVLGNSIPVGMGLLLLPNTIHITTFC